MIDHVMRVAGWRSLHVRFFLMVIAGAGLFAVLAGGFAYRYGHDRALASSRSVLEGLVAAVDKTVAVGVFANDPVLLREVADGLARNELVAQVEILGANGLPLTLPAAQPAMPAAPTIVIERALVSPFDPAEHIGTLRISAMDERVAAAANREAYLMAAAMATQAGLVALLLYLLAARLVSRPIVQLAQELQRIAPGAAVRLATPAAHRHDELGMLIASANALLESNERTLRAERELRAEIEAMEAQYRQIFDSSSAGIFVLDAKGRLINGNPTVSKVVGVPMAQLCELQTPDFIARVFDRPEQVRAMIAEAARRGETVSADLELVEQGRGRRWVHCLISVQGAAAGQPPAASHDTVEGVVYDITERKSDENAVRYRAEHDALTGLHNRGASQLILERLASEADAAQLPLAVACVDLDGFKQINDLHGHAAGDEVLLACARRMRAGVRRASDLVGRLGGDEFVIALRGIGPEDPALRRTLESLLASLCSPIQLSSGAEVRIGASIGVACLPRDGRAPAELTAAADAALYRVKRAGKNAFAMAEPPAPDSAPAPAPDLAPGSVHAALAPATA